MLEYLNVFVGDSSPTKPKRFRKESSRHFSDKKGGRNNMEEKTIIVKDLKCPVCGNPVNWIKNIGNYRYDEMLTLLAECWSGDTTKKMPQHLFIIKLNKLPELDLTEEEDSEVDEAEDYY